VLQVAADSYSLGRYMADSDYLDARVRRFSESVNTDASSTVVSPLATPIPGFKPPPPNGIKFQTNTILKSHGRPPWYFLGLLLVF
jgi:hypothetical protein